MNPPTELPPDVAAILRQAGAKARHWTERRDVLIRDAIAAGASLRAVADAVGLSHTAVRFIATGRPQR